MGNLRAVVDVYLANLCNDNTKKAYAPKVNEFKAFCDHAYPSHCMTVRYTVGPEKLYRFLFYQVFREKKEAKGRKRGQSVAFDSGEYVRVVAMYYVFFSTLSEGVVGESLHCINESVPDPVNPLGFDMINTYRSSVKGYYSSQWELGANRLAWEQINTPSIQKLMSIAKGRKKRTKKNPTLRKLKPKPAPSTRTTRSEKSNSLFVLPVPQ